MCQQNPVLVKGKTYHVMWPVLDIIMYCINTEVINGKKILCDRFPGNIVVFATLCVSFLFSQITYTEP